MQKYKIYLLILLIFFALSLKAQIFTPMLLSEFPDSELYSKSKAQIDSQQSPENQHMWLVSEKLVVCGDYGMASRCIFAVVRLRS